MRCKTSKFLSVILVGLLWTSCWGQSRGKSAEEPKTLEIGEHAPDFSLPGVDGRNYKLADFAQADILVVVFTCNHCPTAQAYEDRIKKLAADYKNKGVVLVAISPNDPQALRLDELGYT
jgi:peroxiredoxin